MWRDEVFYGDRRETQSVTAGANGGTDPGDWPRWRWDVALSSAGAQRDYARQVAAVLKAREVRCFYFGHLEPAVAFGRAGRMSGTDITS